MRVWTWYTVSMWMCRRGTWYVCGCGHGTQYTSGCGHDTRYVCGCGRGTTYACMCEHGTKRQQALHCCKGRSSHMGLVHGSEDVTSSVLCVFLWTDRPRRAFRQVLLSVIWPHPVALTRPSICENKANSWVYFPLLLWMCALSACLSGDFIVFASPSASLQVKFTANPPKSALQYFIPLLSLHCLWIFPFSYFIAFVPAQDCVRISTDLLCQDWLDNLMVFMAVLFFSLVFSFAPFNYFWWLSTPRDIDPPGKWDQVHTTFAEGNMCSLHEYAMWFKHTL